MITAVLQEPEIIGIVRAVELVTFAELIITAFDALGVEHDITAFDSAGIEQDIGVPNPVRSPV